eukprot:CAMPEP_0178417940 /NCGR_PEP_ID=MMETSP0689_2-20121128/24831_1 /TAXON_ID=160604 /ORGANISM="Amphidinium massartii, Strain CS-259" /LENGTH=997 /DNA_ID=CAMNT_0020039317 /DNA_START=88 /DNA_END=3081 /DNA_ORIENTATION=+
MTAGEAAVEAVEDHIIGAWIFVIVTSVLLVPALWRLLSFLRSEDYKVRRESWLTVRVIVILVSLTALVTARPIVENSEKVFPGFRGFYPWLSFWFLGQCQVFAGSLRNNATHALLGTALMVLFLSYGLQLLMPGGAGLVERDVVIFGGPLLPGGYNAPTTIILGMIFVYTEQLLQLDPTTKTMLLALFSGAFIDFMNPNHEDNKEIFYGAPINSRWKFNARGSVALTAYSILGAVALAALAIPVFRPWRRASRDWVSAHHQLATWYREVAVDTMGTLRHLVEYLAQDDASALSIDIDLVQLDINKLGARRAEADRLMPAAEWEIWGRASLRRRLGEMKRFSALLRDMRQVLRLLSEQCRVATSDDLAGLKDPKVVESLLEFQQRCVEGLEALLNRDSTADSRKEACKEAAEEADSLLVEALKRLQGKEHAMQAAYSTEMSIIDNLRRWPCTVLQVLEVETPDMEELTDAHSWHWHHILKPPKVCCKLERHLTALRCLLSWSIALAWCIERRNYSSTCLVTVSFLFSSSVGSLREITIQRVTGVALGVVCGNLPATLLQYGEGGKKLPRFKDMPQYLVSYLILLVIPLSLSVHGSISSSVKNGYVYFLWTGFMVAIAITHLMNEYMDDPTDLSPSLFMTVMDNICASLILLAVDMSFAVYITGTTGERATWSLSAAYEAVSDIVVAVSSGNFTDLHEPASKLDQSIKMARKFDEEMQKEDPLLMPAFLSKSYDANMVSRLLDELDVLYIAARAFGASATRLDDSQESAVSDLLPPTMAKLATLYASALSALLLGGKTRSKRVQKASASLGAAAKTVSLEQKALNPKLSVSTVDAVIEALKESEEAHVELETGLDEATLQEAPAGVKESVSSQAARHSLLGAAATFNTSMQRTHTLLQAFAASRGKAEALNAPETLEGKVKRPFPRADTAAFLATKSTKSPKTPQKAAGLWKPKEPDQATIMERDLQEARTAELQDKSGRSAERASKTSSRDSDTIEFL